MIVRIVNLTFREGGKADFYHLIEQVGDQIRRQPGCVHLEILEDIQRTNAIMTYSHWVDEQSLNDYRNSQFFSRVWPQIKDLLIEPAMARSYMTTKKIE